MKQVCTTSSALCSSTQSSAFRKSSSASSVLLKASGLAVALCMCCSLLASSRLPDIAIKEPQAAHK